MPKFDFDQWFREKGKNKVTNVQVPVPGKERPAKFRLAGLCNATIADIIKLGNEQTADIPGNYPMETTEEGVTLRRRAGFEASDFANMLHAIAKEGGEVSAGETKTQSSSGNGNGNSNGNGHTNRIAGASV